MNPGVLNQTHGIGGALIFAEGQGGLPAAFITTAHADAVVSLYGGHVMSYRPAGTPEVLWMSAASEFEEGTPIRGGIPLCFPWFGPHGSDARKPQHGFARLQMWTVAGTSALPDGGIELRLTLTDSPASKALWPHAFLAELIVRVGASLEVVLRCTNTGSDSFTYSDALHSYLAVSDIARVNLRGLGGAAYHEGMSPELRHQDGDVLKIRKEENRRYVGTTAMCTIEDAGIPRTIRVAKTGSHVTVVWNPWEATAKKIADMPDDGYRTMLCVEAVNAYDDAVTLKPGEQFSLGTIITVLQ